MNDNQRKAMFAKNKIKKEKYEPVNFYIPRRDLSLSGHGRDANAVIYDICGCKSCRASGEMKRRESGKPERW